MPLILAFALCFIELSGYEVLLKIYSLEIPCIQWLWSHGQRSTIQTVVLKGPLWGGLFGSVLTLQPTCGTTWWLEEWSGSTPKGKCSLNKIFIGDKLFVHCCTLMVLARCSHFDGQWWMAWNHCETAETGLCDQHQWVLFGISLIRLQGLKLNFEWDFIWLT